MPGNPEPPSSSAHKIIGFLLAGALVVAAAMLFRLYAPGLKGPTPGQALRIALEAQFPDSQPQVTLGDELLLIALEVPFDPTIDAELAHETFQRTLTVAETQDLKGPTSVEILLTGTSIEGRATSASRTFDYTPQPID